MTSWRKLASFGNQRGISIVTSLSEDIVDYFVDLANATDRIEMGGFILGKIKKVGGVIVIQLHDFFQAPNIANETSKEYMCSEESENEAIEMVNSEDYDILCHYHTHPSDSLCSMSDIKFKYNWLKANPHIQHPPDFLVTGGDAGYIISYLNAPFFLYLDLGTRYVGVESEPFRYNSPEYVSDVMSEAKSEFPEQNNFYKYMNKLHVTVMDKTDIWREKGGYEKYMKEKSKSKWKNKGMLGFPRPFGFTPLKNKK